MVELPEVRSLIQEMRAAILYLRQKRQSFSKTGRERENGSCMKPCGHFTINSIMEMVELCIIV